MRAGKEQRQLAVKDEGGRSLIMTGSNRCADERGNWNKTVSTIEAHIIFDCLVNIGKHLQSPIDENAASGAKAFDRRRGMRDHDYVSVLSPLEEGRLAARRKPGIADRRQFIDEIAFERNSHGHGERKPRAHPGRVGLDRHVEIIAKFRKSLRRNPGRGGRSDRRRARRKRHYASRSSED